MSGICKRTILPTIFVTLLIVLFTSSVALAASERYFIAYHSTETTPTNRSVTNYNSTLTAPTDFNAANGQGGSVTLNNANMNWGVTKTGNSGSSTNTIVVTPDATHQIKSIYWIRWDSTTSNISNWTNKTPGTDKISPVSFSDMTSSSTSARTWYIWVVFEDRPVAATYTITGKRFPIDYPGNIDTTSAAYICSSTGFIDTVTPAATTSVNVSGVALNATPTYYLGNSNALCQVDKYSDDNGASWSTANLLPAAGPYTSLKTDPIPGNYNFYVSFSLKQYTITSTIDPSGSTTCGSVTPPTNTYNAGSSQVFTILPNPGCAVASVLVTDPNKGYATPTDVTATVVAAGNQYTFNNILANGAITVKLITVATTLGGQYCQVPPFIAGQSTLKPNVLIIFDNSGSMGNYPYLDNSTAKPYTCDTSNKTTTAPTGVACTLANINNFYGYFAKDQMYLYTSTSKKFTKDISGAALSYKKATSVSKCSDITTGTILSGNYLNYLCMQKLDIVKNILIGGAVDATAGAARGAGNGTTSFFLKTMDGHLVEYGKTEPQGLIHDSIAKVRFGLMTFNDNGANVSPVGSGLDGGELVADLGSDLNTMVTKIEAVAKNGYTPLAESFYEAIRYYQAGSSAYNGTSYASKDPVQYSCQKHFVIMLTDGEPTNDQNVPGATGANVTDAAYTSWYAALPVADRPPASYTGTSFPFLPKLTYYAHNNDLRPSMPGNQNITFYAVYAFGDGSGTAILKDAAKFGGYVDGNKNNKPDTGEYNGTYYEATDGDVLSTNLSNVFSSIISATSSGTAAAVANNKSGERGANIVQALFYPQWPNDANVKWLGEMLALWYYLDPMIENSGIYEDTVPDKKLILVNSDKYPSKGSFNTNALWRAGSMLQTMNAADRKIYTLLDSGSTLMGATNEFKTTNLASLRPLMNLGLSTGAINDTQAGYLINYLRGTDRTEYRPRKVLFTDPITVDATTNPSGTPNTALPTEWKLGDIINATPQVQSSIQLNYYDSVYDDKQYPIFTKSKDYMARNVVYTSSNDGLLHAFRLGLVSNNHDIAHPEVVAQISGTELGKEEWAFIPKNALPYLQNQAGTEYCHQCLVDGPVVLVDASIKKISAANYWSEPRKTTVTTANDLDFTQTTWKTVLVGGMGLGGASRDFAENCNETLNHDAVATNNLDCVKTPKTGIGMSSFFALDVTKPLVPEFMWEFSDYSIANDSSAAAADKGLGFTTAGPVVMRVTESDPITNTRIMTTNGRWFAVFASGPTGAIDQASRQFTGRSDQNLKIYIVDLNATMPFTKNVNYWVKDTGIKYAFASSLAGSVIDVDRGKPGIQKGDAATVGMYSDDAAYISYTRASLDNAGYPTAWDKGGVIRLMTNNDIDPANWFVSDLIKDIGPVTSSIAKAQEPGAKGALWIFFGEGRYFFSGDEVNVSRKFYGVKDPCYNAFDGADKRFGMEKTAATCTAVSVSDLQDQGGDPPALTLDLGKKGWFISMEPASVAGTTGAERVISDVTANLASGNIFFTTFTPNTNVCVPGGSTSMWAVKYNTGGIPKDLFGKVPVQTSSGGITMVDMATAFTAKSGRKIGDEIHSDGTSLMGMASHAGPRTLMLNRGIKKIVHIQEQ